MSSQTHLLIMKKLLLVGLLALTQSSLRAQLLSYDFEEDNNLAANEGTLGRGCPKSNIVS